MVEIHRSALVNYPPERMFSLVGDVEDYPERFPWCSSAAVLERDGEDTIVARLDLRFAGLHHSFTTRNVADEPHSITISLVAGPFKSLEGLWSFEALGETGCKVSLRLNFDYTGRIGNMALKLGFQGLANRMVDDFCREARRVYG